MNVGFLMGSWDSHSFDRRAVTRELFSVTTELTLMFESTSHSSMDCTPSLRPFCFILFYLLLWVTMCSSFSYNWFVVSVELEYGMDMKSCQDVCSFCDTILTFNARFFCSATESCVSQYDTGDIKSVCMCFCNGIKGTLHTLASLGSRRTDRSHKIMYHGIRTKVHFSVQPVTFWLGVKKQSQRFASVFSLEFKIQKWHARLWVPQIVLFWGGWSGRSVTLD